MNHGGAWSRALLTNPSRLVATRSSSGRALASALTPRLVRVPCAFGLAKTILKPERYFLPMAFQLVDDILPHVEAWKELGARQRGPRGLSLSVGNASVCKHFIFEGPFGVEGLGRADCHFHFISAMTLIERAEMLVARDNGHC